MKETDKSDDPKTQNAIRSVTVDVSSKHCLWFAWWTTSPPTKGPEEEDDSSKPIGIPIPQEPPVPSKVLIEATDPTQVWRHHPADGKQSGADGISVARGLENGGYKSDSFNSNWIELPGAINLNKAVAIFEVNGLAPTQSAPQTQKEVGSNATLTIPENATKLFLGFHDGRQWTNNENPVTSSAEIITFRVSWLTL